MRKAQSSEEAKMQSSSASEQSTWDKFKNSLKSDTKEDTSPYEGEAKAALKEMRQPPQNIAPIKKHQDNKALFEQ